MNIETTSFDSNYHSSQKAGNNTYGEYVFHNVDVYNIIKINGEEFYAVYQAGGSFDHNDINCPSLKLTLSSDAGTSELLAKLNALYESDIDGWSDEEAAEFIEECQEYCRSIKTTDDVKNLYAALNDNKFGADAEFGCLDLSDDLDDYEEDEATGLLSKKSA